MNPKANIDPAQLRELWSQGKTDVQMARFFGVGPATIQRHRATHNLTGYPKGKRKKETISDTHTLYNVSEIVADDALLREVLEHACKVNPGLVAEILRRTDERLTAVIKGGYIEVVEGYRLGRKR